MPQPKVDRVTDKQDDNAKYDDFDSPWKDIVEWHFEDFMLFFLPEGYADIDWNQRPEFLDKELQQIMRDTELGRRYADKLISVRRKSGEEEWVLVHLEVQGQSQSQFDKRIYHYNHRLYDRYNRTVVSIVIVNDETRNWKPGKFALSLWGCKLTFEYPVIKLADYAIRWDELEASDNVFATVVMAHLKALETQKDPEARHYWKFYLIRRLYERGYDRQAILNLFHFIDWLLRLPEDLEAELDRQLDALEAETSMQYITSIERRALDKGRQEGREEGRQEGREEGREEGQRNTAVRLLLRLLNHRFTQLPADLPDRIQHLNADQIEALMDSALTSDSFAEFAQHIPVAQETNQ